jgi:hypothetical protein
MKTNGNENAKVFGTNYGVAVNWLGNNLILCNEIVNVDFSMLENCRFSLYDEETETQTEIFQWYVTDCSSRDVEFLEKSFGLLFTYSDKLDVYVLCVDHCGTSWDYVECDCYNDEIPDGNLKE